MVHLEKNNPSVQYALLFDKLSNVETLGQVIPRRV